MIRYTELDVQGRYSAVKDILEQRVHQAAKIVNQIVLLSHLHKTRECNPLLEPITDGRIRLNEGKNN